MNKNEIMAALTAAGVTFDPSMTVAQLTELAGANNVSLVKTKAKPELVTVTATTNLVEAGNRYAPGDTFQVTEERAASLGDVVKVPLG